MNQEDTSVPEIEPTNSKCISKKPKRGIIYLSSIPPYMNVSKIREIFSEFGTVGRVYLQMADIGILSYLYHYNFNFQSIFLLEPTGKEKKSKKRKYFRKFTEGWVEFERKLIAKKVAALLNNTQVSNRKKSKLYDYIWNIKYLSSFKWTHLHERLAYEKAARRQKLRAEIQLAKKKTNFFSANLNKAKKDKTFINKEYENLSAKSGKDSQEKDQEDTEDRTEFLQSLFS